MQDHESMPTIPMETDEELLGCVKTRSFLLDGISTGERPLTLDEELSTLEEEYRSLWTSPAEASEALRPARKLYHALGIDPSKTRPSSEALLRRVLKRKPLYRVNAVIDAANLASLTLLLPVGLYDAKKIVPPVLLRLGREGEEYAGIRKDAVHLHGRPTLSDTQGPFGNPTSDSFRTSITSGTTTIWFVLFAPPDYPDPTLMADLGRAASILQKHALGPA